MSAWKHPIRRFARSERGSAAAEFAIWLGVLTVPLLSAVDVAWYAIQSMQVGQAAQSAAQTAFTLCNGTTIPVASNCTNFHTQLTTSLQSTSLGSNVAWASSSESWYCVNTSNALTLNDSTKVVTINTDGSTSGSIAKSPPTCSGSSAAAGDYVTVNVTYTYKPIFKGLSILTAVLPTTITRSAVMRVN